MCVRRLRLGPLPRAVSSRFVGGIFSVSRFKDPSEKTKPCSSRDDRRVRTIGFHSSANRDFVSRGERDANVNTNWIYLSAPISRTQGLPRWRRKSVGIRDPNPLPDLANTFCKLEANESPVGRVENANLPDKIGARRGNHDQFRYTKLR